MAVDKEFGLPRRRAVGAAVSRCADESFRVVAIGIQDSYCAGNVRGRPCRASNRRCE